jgi:pimeloyl-ACP methyl ester carboxylesterase
MSAATYIPLMTASVEVAGVALAYEERGEGPAVLLVHGMADRAAGWNDVMGELAGEARVIAYDRRGYGTSGAPEPYGRTTVEEQAEDAAGLLRALDAGPAVVCGRDVGALVALDLIRRHGSLVRSAVLVDPALYQLLADATEALSVERVALEDALREGGPARAAETWLAAHGAPPERAATAGEDAGAFFADYGSIGTWPVLRRDLREIAVPVAVVVSPRAPGWTRATATALARLLPGRGEPEENGLPDVLRRLL